MLVNRSLFILNIILTLVCGYLTESSPNTDNDLGPITHRKTCNPLPIQQKACRFYYNDTGMPNLVGQEQLGEAEHQLLTFAPLIKYGCSVKLQFFLCSVYTPMCDKTTRFLIGPCRPLCEHVRDRCLPVLKAFNVMWPENLNCSRFPESNRPESMCMQGPRGGEEGTTFRHNFNIHNDATGRKSLRKCNHLSNPNKYVYVNHTGGCRLKCNTNNFFSTQDKQIAEIWVGVFATLCFISTLFTGLTFIIDRTRFRYPERPIIFLAMCYFFYSTSYFLRLGMGRETTSCEKDPVSGESVLVYKSLENRFCAVSFLIQYFFGTASSMWWVIHTITWVLAAGLKWSDEAIERRACYLHIAAWLIPTVLSLIVLLLPALDADELLGMCSVGQQDEAMLLIFVIIPSCLFLVLGSVFLLSGFVSFIRIRRLVKNDGIKTDKLEALMGRLGLFSILYIVPAACVVSCNVYEYATRNQWRSSASRQYPNFSIFILKSFMSLVVGITSNVSWVWSLKTLESWRVFLRNIVSLFCNCICQRQQSKDNLSGIKSFHRPGVSCSPTSLARRKANPEFLPLPEQPTYPPSKGKYSSIVDPSETII